MFTPRRTQLFLLGFLFVAMLLPGCTNWQRRYEYLAVEHENLKGRYDKLAGERQQMANRISEDQRTIEELTRQIEEDKRTPADATGFGPGYDVAFDPVRDNDHCRRYVSVSPSLCKRHFYPPGNTLPGGTP